MTIVELKDLLARCAAAQHEATIAWHKQDEDVVPPETIDSDESMLTLALAQHRRNYLLWHVEDEARRRDVGDNVIAECKRTIDGLNQKRNDLIERLDEAFISFMAELLPVEAEQRFNTETIGSALDRMSIMSLKIFHMKEQVERADVGQEHRDNCARKVAVLMEQRGDLLASSQDLLDEYAEGKKRPKVYFQFKMYNDPSLNPAVYGSAGS